MGTHHQRKRRYPRKSTGELAAITRCKDLEGQLETALRLMHAKGIRIADLSQRLGRAVDANQTLRVENARLRVMGTGRPQ